MRSIISFVVIICLLVTSVAGQDLQDLDISKSEVKPLIERYVVDRGSLMRRYNIELSSVRTDRLKRFYNDYLTALAPMSFDTMSQDGKVDYLTFKAYINNEIQQLELRQKATEEIKPFIPFLQNIVDLAEGRRLVDKIDSAKMATSLTILKKTVEDTRRNLESQLQSGQSKPKRSTANRAANALNMLRNNLRDWYNFYNGYDPMFTWWMAEPYKALDQSLTDYSSFLLVKYVGVRSSDAEAALAASGGGRRGGFGPGSIGARAGDSSDIIGDPVGRDGLITALERQMIPYTPEELIAIGYKELEWCDNEKKKAAREMGFGDDWQKALESVKNKYVPPGDQTFMIKDLALDALNYVKKNDLLTISPLAEETWRMEMMSPERQLVNPFFLGGEAIIVSYPTNTMTQDQKMMSMRGNNPHFSMSTVHHELIPGHHFQMFMNDRFKSYRELFGTPFSIEGWALYWELLLWDMKYPKSPEDRLGFLFWRSHRCARIVFSLSFHMEKMTPKECIDLLIDRVGHEPENAIAEVRRSFAGSYEPLYQAAYLLGGLQLYSMRKELTESKKMTIKQFHDRIMKENQLPMEMMRALLSNQKLTSDFKTSWKFYSPRIEN